MKKCASTNSERALIYRFAHHDLTVDHKDVAVAVAIVWDRTVSTDKQAPVVDMAVTPNAQAARAALQCGTETEDSVATERTSRGPALVLHR